MPKTILHTYADVVSHLMDYLGAATDGAAERAARMAVQNAYKELPTLRRWNYFYQRGRIATVAPYTTGTIEYDHTGGTYERQVTLTSGTWPTWAAQGCLVIDNVVYDVAERKSSTVITLTPAANPGADVAALTTYTLYRDTYPLPVDFQAADLMQNIGHALLVTYQKPGTWMGMQSIFHGPATPRCYTVTGDPNYIGALAARFFPPPDQAYNFDFIYTRRPRQLDFLEIVAGTVSVTSGSTTVTGSGTAFASLHAGNIIRFSDTNTDKPTGLGGTHPATLTRAVQSVTTATTLVLDADPQQNLSGVAYSISPPIDIEEGAMWTFFLRLCERHMRIIKRMKTTADEERQYREAQILAYEADSRDYSPRAAGDAIYHRSRLDMPAGPDVS